jgi:hypothetical protein
VVHPARRETRTSPRGGRPSQAVAPTPPRATRPPRAGAPTCRRGARPPRAGAPTCQCVFLGENERFIVPRFHSCGPCAPRASAPAPSRLP